MIDRSHSLLLLHIPILLTVAGCAVPKQTRFQMPFVPPASSPSGDVETTEPPSLAPNIYLNGGAPNIVLDEHRMIRVPTPSDMLIVRADEAYQKGKRPYQTGDKEKARKQFDHAMDLLFEASENPSDRQAFERKFEEIVDSVSRYDLAGLGPALNIEEPRFEKSPFEDILEMTFPVDPRLKTKVKEELQATVSQLPLEMNDSVLGFIHFFSGRGRKTMIAGMQRAGRYRPLIRRILDEEGVPQELIYLAQAESGFFPRAVSNKQATGMWQFVQFRGREYGLMQTPYSDDRLDPEKATRSAARHLRDLYTKFGDWYLAIAAYNCGPGNVERAVERTGYADFWELRSRKTLPIETTNYVPIILAMTIMAKNAKEYGLDDVISDPPLEYDVAVMASPTHVALIADLTETPVSEIQASESRIIEKRGAVGLSGERTAWHGEYSDRVAADSSAGAAGLLAHAQSGERRDLGDDRQEIRSSARRDRCGESNGVGNAGGRRSPGDPANRGPCRGEEPGGPPVERHHGAQRYCEQGRRGKEDRRHNPRRQQSQKRRAAR